MSNLLYDFLVANWMRTFIPIPETRVRLTHKHLMMFTAQYWPSVEKDGTPV